MRESHGKTGVRAARWSARIVGAALAGVLAMTAVSYADEPVTGADGGAPDGALEATVPAEPFMAGLSAYEGSFRFGKADGTYAQNEWQSVGGKRYYFDAQGVAVKGACAIDGKLYLFGEDAVQYARPGWIQWDDGTWSLLNGDGSACIGWYKYAGRDWYYFSPETGRSLRWEQKIDGQLYFFNGASVMITGWHQFKDGSWALYRDSGAARKGWYKYAGRDWYYFSPEDGHSARWFQEIDGQFYYFKGNSVMKTGWQQWKDGTWSLFTASGAAKKGWYLYNKRDWYYFSPETGCSLRGEQLIDGRYYYLKGNSVMKTGWHQWGSGNWSFYKPGSGHALTGWQKIGGKWYYLSRDNRVALKGNQLIDGKWYTFNGSCQMRESWVKNGDGTWCYYKPGSGCALRGWQKIGGVWYYLDPESYKAATGLREIDSQFYYFNGSCAMQTGWVAMGNNRWSYFYPSGARANGTCTIDGTRYTFGEDGTTDQLPSITGDFTLDGKVRNLAGRLGSLSACFNWTKNHTHKNWAGNRSYAHGRYGTNADWVRNECARMINGQQTDCYAFAATFGCLAKALGYDVRVVSGSVPRISGGQAAHGWVEIVQGGTTYVYDPDMARGYPTYNFYKITYGSAPLNYRI